MPIPTLISLVDARKGLKEKCMELFRDERIAGDIYRYLCEGIDDCKAMNYAFSEYMNEPKISEDGTLVVNVPDASAVGRVLVGDNRNVGGLYYPSDEGSEPKWIEIYEGQENLPPLGKDVLLCVINGSEDVGFLMKDEEGLIWKVGTWYNDFLEWDAWRYLPEPYEYPPNGFMNPPEGSENEQT